MTVPDRPAASSIASRLRHGATLNFLGALFNQGSTFALNIAVANIVGRELFGRYTIAQTTLAMIASVAQLAMGYTATKYVAECRDHDVPRTGRILGLCSAISWLSAAGAALLLFAVAPWLAGTLLRAPDLVVGLRLLTGAVFFTVLNGFRAGTLAGFESYRALAWSGIVSGCAYFAVGVASASLAGVRGALLGLSISAFVQWIVLGVWVSRERRTRGIRVERVPKVWWAERQVLTRFALPATLSGLVSVPALWLASVMLARQPDGYQQLALFGAANSFRSAVLFIPQTVNAVGVSLLNNQRAASRQGYREVFWLNVRVNASAATVGAAAVVFAAPWLLRLFGPEFQAAYVPLLVLMGVTVLEAVAIATYQAIQSHERMWLSLFTIALPRDAIIVCGATIMVGVSGASGLAAAYLVGWVVAVAMTSYLTHRLQLVSRPAQSTGARS